MTKQISISDQVYAQLNAIRLYRGRKYSFNTVLSTLLKENARLKDPLALYQHMQWQAIVAILKQMEEDGWITNYEPHYAHAMRMIFNGEYGECCKYLAEQLPDKHDPPVLFVKKP